MVRRGCGYGWRCMMTAITRQAFTASNDGTDVSDYAVIGAARGVARFFASGNANTGNPTLELALVDVDGGTVTVLGRYPATCTVSARRADEAGTGGDYLFDIAFDADYGGNNKFDLMGGVLHSESKTAEWRVGVTALDGQTTVTVGWVTTEVV